MGADLMHTRSCAACLLLVTTLVLSSEIPSEIRDQSLPELEFEEATNYGDWVDKEVMEHSHLRREMPLQYRHRWNAKASRDVMHENPLPVERSQRSQLEMSGISQQKVSCAKQCRFHLDSEDLALYGVHSLMDGLMPRTTQTSDALRRSEDITDRKKLLATFPTAANPVPTVVDTVGTSLKTQTRKIGKKALKATQASKKTKALKAKLAKKAKTLKAKLEKKAKASKAKLAKKAKTLKAKVAKKKAVMALKAKVAKKKALKAKLAKKAKTLKAKLAKKNKTALKAKLATIKRRKEKVQKALRRKL